MGSFTYLQPSRTRVREGCFRSQGFTLVELVVVIVLIGILSVYAASRYTGTDDFSALTAQEQAISVIRQVQLHRMQSNVTSPNENAHYVLALQTHCIGSVIACSRSNQEGNDGSQSNAVFNSNLTFSSVPSLDTVNFDLLGNPLNDAQNGLTILIQATQSTAQVCINRQGYVHRGGC